MKAFLLVAATTLCMAAWAGETAGWYRGVMVLEDESIVQGEVSVHHDIVLFRSEGDVTVYPAHKIRSFYYYDAKANINRRFISQRERSPSVRLFRLYEVVVAGSVSVLRKPESYNVTTPAAKRHEVFDFDYYILKDDQLVPLRKFRAAVFPQLMRQGHPEMAAYMIREKLNPNCMADAIRIIRYHNALVKQPVTSGPASHADRS